MYRTTIIIALAVFMVSSGASPQTNTKQRNPSVSSLKARIPPPKRSVYGAVRDGQDWRNPYLIVNEDGVQVRKKGDDYTAPVVSVGEVMKILEDLPKSGWPYGLVVAVQENGICCRYSDGDERKHANRVDLVDRLKRAG